MSEYLFANIIIDISHEKVDRPFQYIIPQNLIGVVKEGDCVEVPFGKGNSLREGFVIEITQKNEYPVERLKYLKGLSEGKLGVEADAVRLASWMKKTYGSTMIAALKTVLPVKKVVKSKEIKTIIRKRTTEEIIFLYAQAVRKKQKAKVRILEELKNEEMLPYDLVVSKLHVSSSTLTSLVKDGTIVIESEKVYRNPVNSSDKPEDQKILSKEQADIVSEITSGMSKNMTDTSENGKYLIHGITGSGKTEVYIKLIEHAIKEGRQCIMLIPEIALTYQTLMRFYKRFGDRVSVMNSTLSAGEKYDQCMRAYNGDIDVIIGPRSALFVPFRKLGLVIIDEEHESSYISENNPRYHARQTAEELCRIKGATLVLGSATPSIETYFLAKNGYYKLFQMTKRLTGNQLAKTSIVDLREELKNGNRSVLSLKLKEAIADRLNKKEQIMLFLNRRGYSGFVSCRACGHVMKCNHCDVSLSRHRGGKLICHYCGYQTQDVKICPECGSKYISGFKAGTQQIEDELKKIYPEIRVLRMDADTTGTKDSYENILSSFAEGEADVLVGTQMIVKGHDFPNVTLVGILAADLSLNDSDFRTAERTFQLLTQAIGRAGRGEKEGEAIIQTYRPDHYSIIHSAHQDYEGFYKEEIAYRMLGDYPPAGAMMHIRVQSAAEMRAESLAKALAKRVVGKVRVIGPAPDTVSKVKDMFRFNLYLKGEDIKDIEMSRNKMEEYLETAPIITETVSFDLY
ncbi:MAG: primosomal protein N' [Lachnospiraceae bacterium]|nr:primosomal protein N' [Lachnospiraceae bacterium]